MQVPATSGIFTGAWSIYTNKPDPGTLTSAAAINSGVTALVFFTCREYAAGPLLTRFASGQQYASRRRELAITPLPADENYLTSQTVAWSDLRWNKLLDSGLSGAVTGGVLRTMRTGPRTSLSGALTVGAVCTALQYGFNELSIVRLRYISNLQQQSNCSFEETHDNSSDGAFHSLMKLFGVIPVSDDDYLSKLRRSRELYVKRIAELEAQINEDKSLKDMEKPK
ncbi:hypothetical protein CPB83DRAFT_890967 [Crepidotus variabilis]|uniref:Uncharacterized protein n=1 Tax=Crepidotus variabilis TaxID=179855 RepID=A0A9P6ENB0_9AGAR|nr:hypothetical protein CPB83DRAFT_890967 [Crepidotus variabilis]